MKLKHLATMSFLAVVTLFGCSDEKSNDTCGNGKLDGNEACDGDVFRANLRRCPGSTEVSTLVVCTEQCTLDTTACPEVEEDICAEFTPSCDESNGWLKSCNNNTVERIQCVVGDEVCDSVRGCVLVNEPDPCAGFSPYCTGNIWHTCTNKTPSETTCSDATPNCDPVKGCVPAPVVEDKEYYKCEDNKVIYCNGADCTIEHDCSKNGGQCKETTDGDITIAECEYVTTCEGNVIHICSDQSCEVINCAEFNEVCNAEVGDCVAPEKIACKDNHTAVYNDTIEYDCHSNTNDDVICNPEIGCTDIVCDGDTLYLYAREESNPTGISFITEECDPGTCNNKEQKCGVSLEPCDEASTDSIKCSEDQKTVYMCLEGVWDILEECGQSLYCTDKTIADGTGDCEYIAACGNGYIDGDEQCDPGGIDGAAPVVNAVCSRWNDSSYDFLYLDTVKPGCQASCKFDSSKCVKSKDVETKAEDWPLTEVSEFGGKYKDVIILRNASGGYNISKIESGYWNLGYWTKATSPQFDGTYVEIKPQTVTTLSDKTSASIHLTIAQNDTAAPKKIQLAFYNDGEKKGVSRVVTLSQEMTEYIFPISSPNLYNKNFSFRFSAYEANSTSGGTLHIKDMAIYTYTAMATTSD